MAIDRTCAPHVELGLCGTGKTYCLQRMANDFPGVVLVLEHGRTVDDPCEDWPGAMDRGPFALADGADAAARALSAGHRTVIVRPEPDADRKDREPPYQGAARRLAKLACEHDGYAVLIIPDSQDAIPNDRPLPAELVPLVHSFRWQRAGLWADSQHHRDLHIRVRNEALTLCQHGTTAGRDIDELRKLAHSRAAGESLAACAREAARLAAPVHEGGEETPGYHIRIHKAVPVERYELTR